MSEENPQEGGSYIRNEDGTLTKKQKEEAAQAPAEQLAVPEIATVKGAK